MRKTAMNWLTANPGICRNGRRTTLRNTGLRQTNTNGPTGAWFKEVEFALPVELNERQQQEVASSFAADLTGGERLPYTMAIHRGGGDNPHVHLMISERGLDGHDRDAEQWFKRANKAAPEKGGALKTRSFMNKEWLENTRKAWETAANTALDRAGRSERIDHRSLAAQREEAIERGQVDRADELSRQPGVHLGPERYRAQRGGTSRVVELAERIEQSNRADQRSASRRGRRPQAKRPLRTKPPRSPASKRGFRRSMTELETRLMNELTNFAEQYAKDQKRLTEQVVRLAAQYTQDQKRLTGQVERLEEDMRQFTRQYAKDQKPVVERMKAVKRLTGQVERFEGEVKRFVAQLKLGEKQSERLQGRVEELASRLPR